MAFNEFDVVVATTSFSDFGIKAGDVGAIVEVYDDGEYEVEFCNENGETVAMFAVPGHYLAKYQPMKKAA